MPAKKGRRFPLNEVLAITARNVKLSADHKRGWLKIVAFVARIKDASPIEGMLAADDVRAEIIRQHSFLENREFPHQFSCDIEVQADWRATWLAQQRRIIGVKYLEIKPVARANPTRPPHKKNKEGKTLTVPSASAAHVPTHL
jgi:hypothetical protein